MCHREGGGDRLTSHVGRKSPVAGNKSAMRHTRENNLSAGMQRSNVKSQEDSILANLLPCS